MSQGPDLSLMYFVLGIPALVGLAAVVTRRLVVRRVRQLMMASSGQGAAAAPGAPDAALALPPAPPGWRLVDAHSRPPDAIASRELLTARARADFGTAFRHELAIAAAYVLFPLAVYNWPGEGTPDVSVLAFIVSLMAMLSLPFLAMVRYAGFRSQFRAHVPGLAGVLRPFATHGLAIAQPPWRAPIWGLFLLLAGVLVLSALLQDSPAWRTALGYGLAMAAHVALVWRLMDRARRTPNAKLLVLRVFGIDEAALFTFEGLLQYWRHFGTFFTVVDPSFIHSQHRQGSGMFLAVIGSAAVTLMIAANVPQPALWCGLLLAAVVVAAAAHLCWRLQQVERQFLRSPDDVAARLQRLEAWPRQLDLSFRSLPMMCHDDVWQTAVHQTALVSSAVLMDLRGYSADRQGCRYEVAFLLDTVPLAQIVFLADPPDVERIQALILECWRTLGAASPNRAAAAPQVTVYLASAQDDRDIQGILDQLLLASQQDDQTPAAAAA
ncbi:hypothetical protein KAK07_14780 [Ideonella sp. 4Y16]|uniref:hypothetical protein n=1 Tax=Ideonella alba TaxID=2824118 RepID=UPI001B36276E|nr:hypothetical protein [Ideonella alba]MBQ0944601.1 hypothetical protein [Ideonella alba]